MIELKLLYITFYIDANIGIVTLIFKQEGNVASCNKLMKLMEMMRFSKSSTLLLKLTLLGFPFFAPPTFDM